MKYTLDLLPLRAFQGRGTPVGGRGLRLHGGGGYVSSDREGYFSGDEYTGSWVTPEPAAPPPEPAWSPPPEPAWSPPPEPAPAPAPANQWQQTVNDIYQQEFGRQADASGMATFTALLNQGLTGEQMRGTLRASEEGQSYGLSPAPVPPLTAANPNANWEWQPPSYDDFGGTSPASWANTITGERRDLATPTNIQTVRDEVGNVSYVNADTGAAIDTKQLDKNITGYDKEITSLFQDLLGRTPSASEIASYNQQIQSGAADLSELVKGVTVSPEFLQAKMPFLDPNADVNTKFEQGVRGFDAKGLVRGGALEGLPTHYFDPQTGKLAAWFGTSGGPSGTDFYTWHTAEELKVPGAELRLAEESKRDVGAEWRDLGSGALKVGATLAGAYLAGPAAGLVEAGVTTGSVLADAALKNAAMNALTTVASGGSATDVLKAGVIGAVSGAAGSAIGGINGGEGLGSFGNALAKAGVQTGLTALTGGNVPNALIASAISTALPMALDTVIPKGMFDGLPEVVKNSIVNTATRAFTAAATGGDVSDAVLKSILNIAGNTAKAYSANANNLESATTGELGFASGDKGAGGNLSQQLFQDVQSRNDFGTPLPRDDVVNSILQQDAQDVMNRNVPPPLVQAAIDQNTPRTAENVVIPPLIQQATGQSDANDINQFFANYTPNAGAPLGTYAGATTSDVNPITLQDNNVQQNEFLSPEEMRDFNGDPIPSGSGITLQEWLRDKLSGGGFKSSPLAQEAPPKYGSDVPQVDAQGNLVRTYEPRESYSPLSKFGQGSASALDNTVGGILPMATQLVSYLGLRTYDEILQAVSSMVESDYKANPEEVRLISHKLAGLLSQPFGKAGDVIAGQFTGRPDDVTGSGTYENEITGRALRGVDSALNTGADYISDKTDLPAGDVRFMTDLMLLRPGQTAALAREGITAAQNVGRGFADSATNVINEGPTGGAYNLGATVADLTRAPDTSLMRGDPPTRNINLGEIIDEAQPYVSPEKLSAPTRALEYSPPEVAPTVRSPLSTERIAALEQMFTDSYARPTYDAPPRSATEPATQLAPESRGALPTTFAEAPTIRPIDLGPNLTKNSLVDITEQARTVDQNRGSRAEPQLQAQKSLIDNVITTFAENKVDPSVVKFWENELGKGAYSGDVIDGIKNTFDNKAASPEVILKQVDEATSQLKNLDEQLPAKLAMLSNAEKLGITPREAIELGLLNKNGTKTELGEKVLPTTKPQPKPQPKPYPDPVVPVRPVKPVLPIKPVLPPIIKPPIINPPPIVNPPPPIINPPIDNPPIDIPPIDINPPTIKPPPLVQAAITPPKVAAPAAAMTPSYMYSGAGSQGTTIGALPGNLQATFLQGANVDEYNPFENYNVYQQLGSPAPIRAAQGGSPLQLAQMQKGITGIDPSLYSVLQKRAAPSYFTYGEDTSGGNPTTFAGSQMMGKPMPGIPVIPTGQKAGADWLYQGSGTNPLAMAGTGIPSLPGGMMAHGGQAHGGEGEHIPEFITGATGHYVRGRGDGQSDDIPAMLADGEYVFDASTVSTLGNGSSDAGAKLLDAFRESLRDHTRSAPADKIPPKASPLEYMKEALQHVGRK